jgi:carbon-monoxide dehydrogenase medium subunit
LVQAFDYSEPSSLREAVSLLSDLGHQARVVAGGTDLLVQMKMERLSPTHLVSLQTIPGLGEITVTKEGLLIGALTSIRSIEMSELIQTYFPALTEACASFSTTQIQMMGTIGGNLCNASPASDTAPPLITYCAEAHILGPNGERHLPLEEFFLDPGSSALDRGELLTAVFVPWPEVGTGSAFMKVSRVAADIAKVNGSVMLVRKDDRVIDCRITFGSVAPTPLRAPKAEAQLVDKPFTPDLATSAAQSAAEAMEPIDDVRSSARYRKEIVRVLAYEALLKAWDQAAQGAPDPPQHDISRTSARRLSSSNGQFLKISASEVTQVELRVNDESRSVWVTPNDLLLNVLREQLHLTGAKYACGIGECGACTVEIDDQPALACLVLAVSARGKEITTVEGLQESNGDLHPLQQAFIDHAAIQCGYCTPGVLMTAKSLVDENPHPGEQEVREYLKGNLCRCTGYASIVRAVMSSSGVEEVLPEQG